VIVMVGLQNEYDLAGRQLYQRQQIGSVATGGEQQ
jgi:hypothetical protein